MWAKIAKEMGIPWRAAEAMHWQLGEEDIARRAGTVPFSHSSSVVLEQSPKNKRDSGLSPAGTNLSTGINPVVSGDPLNPGQQQTESVDKAV